MKKDDKSRTTPAERPFSLADEPTIQAVALLKVLAHEQRLRILCELVPGPSGVKRIGELAGVAQPFLSQHLGVLRAQGLVCAERDGRQVRYSLCSPAAAGVIQALHAAFCEPASSDGCGGVAAEKEE